MSAGPQPAALPETRAPILHTAAVLRLVAARSPALPYAFTSLIERLAGAPSPLASLNDLIRPPRWALRGLRWSAVIVAVGLALIAPFLAVAALVGFGIAFLIAPVLLPIFLSLIAIEMGLAAEKAMRRAHAAEPLASTPPGNTGIALAAAHLVYRQQRAVRLGLRVYIVLVAAAYAQNILLLPGTGAPGVAGGLLVGLCVFVFLWADAHQTQALAVLVTWTTVWRGDREEKAESARLTIAMTLAVIQIGIYSMAILFYRTFPAALALPVLVGVLIGVRELLNITLASALLARGFLRDLADAQADRPAP
jgi:hypothetical protein